MFVYGVFSFHTVDAILREVGVQKNKGINYKDFVMQILNPIPDTLP